RRYQYDFAFHDSSPYAGLIRSYQNSYSSRAQRAGLTCSCFGEHLTQRSDGYHLITWIVPSFWATPVIVRRALIPVPLSLLNAVAASMTLNLSTAVVGSLGSMLLRKMSVMGTPTTGSSGMGIGVMETAPDPADSSVSVLETFCLTPFASVSSISIFSFVTTIPTPPPPSTAQFTRMLCLPSLSSL